MTHWKQSTAYKCRLGPMDRWSVHAAELIGILYAVNISKIALRHWRTSHTRVRSATILSDSKSALQAVQNPGKKPGQQIIHAILQAARNTKTASIIDCAGLQNPMVPARGYSED